MSECFGITTNIITPNGTNVTLTGDCNSSLEIVITEGVFNEVECLYTAVTEQQSGILLFEFSDGTTSENIHPACCEGLEGIPEIGPKNYYICRTVPQPCVTCCESYSPTNQVNITGWQIFEFITGGTVTAVPSADCCYAYGFVDTYEKGAIRCIEEVVYDPCNGLELIEPAPLFGPIPFLNPITKLSVTVVPTSECCASLGFNFTPVTGGFECYKSSGEKPTVSITNDGCCSESIDGGNTVAITLGSPKCRYSNCNDNATCSVDYNLTLTNAPLNYTITVQKDSGTANVSIPVNTVPVISYSESSGFGNVNFTLFLRNSSGTIVAQSSHFMGHQSFWNNLLFCQV